MSDPMSRYPFTITQQVIWRDMDAMQHVNNAIYFRYFEDVRMALFEQTGVSKHMALTRVGPILASTRCDFRAPLTFPDRIRVGTCIEDIKPKRFTMKYAVYSEGQDVIAAEGEGLIVFYHYGQGRSCEIPQDLLPVLQALAPR